MSVVEKIWSTIGLNVVNYVKVYLLEHCLDDIFSFFSKRLKMVVGRYCRNLPRHVIEIEGPDLNIIAQLELIETVKSWDPIKNEVLWPLAQMRIVGAMRDHIRYLTKSDPSRVYDWVTEQAELYVSSRQQADHVKRYDIKDQIQTAMKVLNDKERYVVYSYSKLDLTFKVIGEKLELSESQVSRIYKKALQKLQKVIHL